PTSTKGREISFGSPRPFLFPDHPATRYLQKAIYLYRFIVYDSRNRATREVGMHAFGYARVSGLGQVDGDGFTRQEEAIQAFAQSHGLLLVKTIREEGVSGTLDEDSRPAFQEMITEAEREGVHAVIVEGMDRLAREYRVQESLLIFLAAHGFTLYSARTGEDVTQAISSDPMQKALVQMQGVFSELEKGMLVRKLKAARDRIRAGKTKCEGRKGYADSAPEIIAEIKRLRRKPKGRPRPTYADVADALNQAGHTTLTGTPFTSAVVGNILARYG
ncbi:MAG: recombinase family protein, partial [Desulfovibrionaceae bacterium]